MKKLGIRINSISLLVTSIIFLITQSIWVKSNLIVEAYSEKAIAGLTFALLAVVVSLIINIVIFTKLNFGPYNRIIILLLVGLAFLFLVLSFSLPLADQQQEREDSKIYTVNLVLYIVFIITYFTAEGMINLDKIKS